MRAQQFLLENLDKNRETRKFLMNLDEAGAGAALDTAISKMYEYSVAKYNKMDFGSIPDSKGDITRFTGYKSTKETLESLENCARIAGIIDFPDLRVTQTALAYLEKNKIEFTKAYLADSYMIIMVYNTVVYSIVAATNLLINEWVDYSKHMNTHPDLKTIRVSKTQQSINGEFHLVRSLNAFNKACESGDMGKFMAQVTKNKDKFIGTAAVIGAGALAASAGIIIASATIVIPSIRQLIYYVFFVRMQLSEYLKNQAEFVKLNAEALTSSNLSSVDAKRVKKKQLDAVKKLEDLSDKIAIKFNDGEKKGKKELDKRLDVKDLQSSFGSTTNSDDSTDVEPSNSGFLL